MRNNKKIFNFIDPNGNDKFSEIILEKNDRLIYLLKKYKLELRDNINIDKNITFGIEIEAEHCSNDDIVKIFKDLKYNYELSNEIPLNVYDNLTKLFDGCGKVEIQWHLKEDRSLTNGFEIVSPALIDSKFFWHSIQLVCSEIRKYAKIGKNAGGHIHIGAQIFDGDINNLIKFIYMWSIIEPIALIFSSGNFTLLRPTFRKYAAPTAEIYKNIMYSIIKKYHSHSDITFEEFMNLHGREYNLRYRSVNLRNLKSLEKFGKKNTIEFRCPNGTLDPVIWQNNINFFVKLINYAKKDDFNYELLGKLDQQMKDQNYFMYLYLAIQFIDEIFDNNLDKLYFLKQFLNVNDSKLRMRSTITKTYMKRR